MLVDCSFWKKYLWNARGTFSKAMMALQRHAVCCEGKKQDHRKIVSNVINKCGSLSNFNTTDVHTDYLKSRYLRRKTCNIQEFTPNKPFISRTYRVFWVLPQSFWSKFKQKMNDRRVAFFNSCPQPVCQHSSTPVPNLCASCSTHRSQTHRFPNSKNPVR